MRGDPREAMMAAMQGGGLGMSGMAGGGDPYGMMQGQGGMGGGMGGGDAGYDMAMGIIMGGGPRRRRCRRC
jgi:hypothetical protein